jgi:hypothetical protein
MAAKIEIVHWDWTEEPDTDWINEGLQAVFDGKHCPFIRNVPDTGWRIRHCGRVTAH